MIDLAEDTNRCKSTIAKLKRYDPTIIFAGNRSLHFAYRKQSEKRNNDVSSYIEVWIIGISQIWLLKVQWKWFKCWNYFLNVILTYSRNPVSKSLNENRKVVWQNSVMIIVILLSKALVLKSRIMSIPRCSLGFFYQNPFFFKIYFLIPR